jgi:hypothetical protein
MAHYFVGLQIHLLRDEENCAMKNILLEINEGVQLGAFAIILYFWNF